jgi:uncharacterized protein (TIGR00369 family)
MALDLQALCDESPLHRRLGVTVRRTEGGVTLEAQVGSEFVSGGAADIVHGGIVGTLLDAAATFALIGRTEHDWVTIDFRVDYLRPTRIGAAIVTGQVVRAGRSIGRASATLADEAGRLCAQAIGTFAPAGEPVSREAAARRGAEA